MLTRMKHNKCSNDSENGQLSDRRSSRRCGNWGKAGLAPLVGALMLGGCTHFTAKRDRINARLVEESRVLTTAVVDTLNAQPETNRDACSEVALRFARQDQRIEGLPDHPLEVAPLIQEARSRKDATQTGDEPRPREMAHTSPATRELERRFAQEDELLQKRRVVTERLEEAGVAAEAQRNARLKRWAKLLSFGGLGIGGLITLVICVPASLPILGRILGWLVGKVPALAGGVGVVSVKAFDAVVRGVERFKQRSGQSKQDPPETRTNNAANPGELLAHLSEELDADHKQLVRCRREKAGFETPTRSGSTSNHL